MKYIMLIIILLLLLVGCEEPNDIKETSISINITETSVETSTSMFIREKEEIVKDDTITTIDIDICINIVKQYLLYRSDSQANMEKIKELLHINRFSSTDKSKVKIEEIRVSYPGKYTLDFGIKDIYSKQHNGFEIYKYLHLFTQYNENKEYKELDFILIQLTKDSPWLIYDWGH